MNVTVTKLNESNSNSYDCDTLHSHLSQFHAAGMYFILGILVPPFLFGLLGLIAIVSIGCLHNSFENKNWYNNKN